MPEPEPEAVLREFALSLPDAVLEHPWGHDVVKVRGKTFVFLGGSAGVPGELSMTVKLPVSSEMALTLPGVEKAGYGLGRSGWISFRRPVSAELDLEMLQGWIVQSYRAVAPKKLAASLP